MNLTSIARRMQRGELHYILGRFRTVRKTYSGIRSLGSGFSRGDSNTEAQETLFPNVRVSDAVADIKRDAVFLGLQLPPDIVSQIRSFAETEPLHAYHEPTGPTFFYREIVRGVGTDGRNVPVAIVSDATRCSAVRAIVDEPKLRAIVRKYLGHEPKKIMTVLFWNFASGISDDERRRLKHHVIDYHYDIEGYNFVYASFYLTDCDRDSGAHVMMKRSHNKKPLSMLLGSAVASEAAVRQQFGIENEIMIEGPAGTGFVQDTSCYHRATPPIARDRLMLAVRFIN